MKRRNLEYEKKFRKYLFSFDFETHKEICKNINVRDNQTNMEEYKIKIILDWMNINQPRNDSEAEFRKREFLKLMKYAVKKKTFKTGRFKDYHIYSIVDHEYLVTPNKENWVLN